MCRHYSIWKWCKYDSSMSIVVKFFSATILIHWFDWENGSEYKSPVWSVLINEKSALNKLKRMKTRGKRDKKNKEGTTWVYTRHTINLIWLHRQLDNKKLWKFSNEIQTQRMKDSDNVSNRIQCRGKWWWRICQ